MNELMPALAVPVIRTPHLTRLVAFYRDAIGFEVVQEVPGVLALLAHGPLRLQLWRHRGPSQGGCRIPLDSAEANVFQLHARLARHARGLLDCASPQLKPWGAWEFSLTDIDGNRLVFVQWVVSSVFTQAPMQPAP